MDHQAADPQRRLIYRARGLLSLDECRDVIAIAESVGFSSARLDKLGRKNQEVFIVDAALARIFRSRLYERSCRFATDDIVEIYKYRRGDTLTLHEDLPRKLSTGQLSNFTMVTWLSDSFEGGEIVFPALNLRARSAMGDALLFSQDLWHRVDPVEKGRKLVARIDIVLFEPHGPNLHPLTPDEPDCAACH